MEETWPKYYRLDGTVPVSCSYDEWINQFKRFNRKVKHSKLSTDVEISTVFLGMDHAFDSDGPPMLFETMIFGIEDDSYQTRCSTWEQALAMHEDAIKYCCLTLEISIEDPAHDS
jgi:hypothetical protein